MLGRAAGGYPAFAMHRPRIQAFLLGVVLLAAAGCGLTRSPLSLDESLQPQDVEEILVLPVIDARPSRLDHVKVARNVGDAAARMLQMEPQALSARMRSLQIGSQGLDDDVGTPPRSSFN